jgi:hypothetical protein
MNNSLGCKQLNKKFVQLSLTQNASSKKNLGSLRSPLINHPQISIVGVLGGGG